MKLRGAKPLKRTFDLWVKVDELHRGKKKYSVRHAALKVSQDYRGKIGEDEVRRAYYAVEEWRREIIM